MLNSLLTFSGVGFNIKIYAKVNGKTNTFEYLFYIIELRSVMQNEVWGVPVAQLFPLGGRQAEINTAFREKTILF